MNANELLASLQDQGVSLSPRGDQLDIEAPPGTLSGELLSQLREHKPEIIAFLNRAAAHATPAPAPPPARSTEPATFVYRCPQCGGTNWGQTGIGYDTLRSGEQQPYEICGCLDCVAEPAPVPLEEEQVAHPPIEFPPADDEGMNPEATASWLASRRGVTNPEGPRVGVKWVPAEWGHLELTNPLAGERVEIPARGLDKKDRWVFNRLPRFKKH